MKWNQYYYCRACIISILFWLTILVTTLEASVAANKNNEIGGDDDDSMKDYSAAVVGLFNNMRTPAALICGAIAPFGIITAPKLVETDTKTLRIMKTFSIVLAVSSLLSEILAITYSSIAINKLVEVQQPQTLSAAHLIVVNHELAWIGTNIHFLFGLLAFIVIVGLKVYFIFGERVGIIAIGWSVAALLQTLSLINRGIAMGHGETNSSSSGDRGGAAMMNDQFASNFFYLHIRYVELLISHAKLGVCSLGAIGVASVAFVQTIRLFLDLIKEGGSRPCDEKKQHQKN